MCSSDETRDQVIAAKILARGGGRGLHRFDLAIADNEGAFDDGVGQNDAGVLQNEVGIGHFL